MEERRGSARGRRKGMEGAGSILSGTKQRQVQ